jgi:hypothetical protein
VGPSQGAGALPGAGAPAAVVLGSAGGRRLHRGWGRRGAPMAAPCGGRVPCRGHDRPMPRTLEHPPPRRWPDPMTSPIVTRQAGGGQPAGHRQRRDGALLDPRPRRGRLFCRPPRHRRRRRGAACERAICRRRGRFRGGCAGPARGRLPRWPADRRARNTALAPNLATSPSAGCGLDCYRLKPSSAMRRLPSPFAPNPSHALRAPANPRHAQASLLWRARRTSARCFWNSWRRVSSR